MGKLLQDMFECSEDELKKMNFSADNNYLKLITNSDRIYHLIK